MTQRPPPHIDPNLITDRSVERLPQGLYDRRSAELSKLLAARPQAPERPPSATRWQDEIIAREIPKGARVLDLGCGNGALLERLMRDLGVRGQGLEIDPEAVFSCVERGVPVMQADLDE